MAAEVDSDLFMSVRLDDSGRICNVLVSSQTTGQDVVECLKPDDDKVYYLVEIWKGCERPISNQEKLKSVLLQWGSDVEDVTFLLKRKLASSRQKQAQKQAESPRGSPVQFEDHLHEQQTKVESMERELHEKENYLKILRAKDGAKNGVKTKYVRHLEMKVLQQEEQLRRLPCLEDELFKYQVDNEKLVLELQRLRSMFAMKHQELVDATVRVELLSEQLTQNYRAGRLRGNPGVSIDEMTRDANTMDSPPSQVASTRKHLPGYFHTPRLTVAQAARLNANNVRNKTLVTTVNRSDSIRNRGSGTVGNGPSSFGDAGVFLEHVELQEHDDLYSLLSWRDEEENDTETSADSGHVSVDHDSPSYRSGGVGSSFQFNGPPGVRYFEKVERFDMDQDFGRPTQPKGPQKEVYSEDMGSLRKSLKESRLSSVEDSLLRRATKHVSRAKASAVRGAPLRETSGLKHSPSEENHRRPLFVQLGQEGRSPVTFPFSKTQSSQDSPQSTSSLSSQSSQMSVTNSDGELRVVNARRRSKSPANEPPRNTSADGVTTSAGQDTRRKSGTGEVNKARTAGSISLYQRNQFDCGSPNPKDHSAARIVGPEEETPVVCPGISFQERRTSDPVIPNQSNLRSTDSKKEGRSSPRVKDREMETSGIVTKQREKPPPEVGGRPVTSAEVQDILNDVPSLTVTPREVRPLQIQTRAEKDSENNGGILPAEKTTSKTSTVQSPVQGPAISDDKSHPAPKLAPKPLPRKRAKTPPARTSGDVVSAVSSSTTISQSTTVDRPTVGKEDFRGQKKRSSSDTMEHVIDGGRSREQKSGKGGACGGPGTSVGESSLKKNGARGSKKSGKRVSLDPHAVLLHASLEGELDLVKSIIHQVEDPSYPNTEGLTALHHAVCNSHDGIVKFLVEYGCDINAADMQGWTSLHCAAANNSLEICKFLVSRGACVFAVTAIEGKTPSQCCEKGSENFKECFSYLSDLENNFGISNDGVVYAVYAYQANRKDELSFESGERLTVVRRGDVTEKDWWWARDSRNQFGYVPRNLLGLCPRIAPDV